MIKGASCPLNSKVLKILPDNMATRMPVKYKPKIPVPARPAKKVPASTIYTGSLAEHDMKGVIRMVSILSFSFSRVRVAMIAGTLHPNPMSMGIKDLPCRPEVCITLSIKNAALAI